MAVNSLGAGLGRLHLGVRGLQTGLSARRFLASPHGRAFLRRTFVHTGIVGPAGVNVPLGPNARLRVGTGLNAVEPPRRGRVARAGTTADSAAPGIPTLRPMSAGATQRTNAELVEEIARRAQRWGTRKGLTGRHCDIGRQQHEYAKKLLIRYQEMFGDRGLSAEVRYVHGHLWHSGDPLRGSLRLDVVEGPLKNPSHVWDYKFFDATLEPWRINQIRTGAGLDPGVPIEEVKPW